MTKEMILELIEDLSECRYRTDLRDSDKVLDLIRRSEEALRAIEVHDE